jgi:low affinity Fe/Cu permease
MADTRSQDHLRRAIQRVRAKPPTPEMHDQPGDRPRASDAFRRFAYHCANKLGSHWAFLCAVLIVLGWAVTGPLFHFSETWQLVINTGTTIVTFLMVFLIQSSQNRDAKAIQLKLDELVRSSQARNVFADLESATEAELDGLQREFEQLREQSRSQKKAPRPLNGKGDAK